MQHIMKFENWNFIPGKNPHKDERYALSCGLAKSNQHRINYVDDKFFRQFANPS